jgi:hypothetical protein
MTVPIQLFSNNAKTTLASGITSSQTTITVASGTGALFPNPSSGQAFKVTLVSATSSTVYEICLCTARSSDTLTVVRAQEGTSGTPFSTGDIVGNYDTAGVMTNLVQSQQLQNQYYLFAVASGTANALTATVPSNLTAIPDGMSIVVKSAYANTGSTTLNLTLGSTSTGALPIVTGNNSALSGGEIPSAGYPITLSYSSTYNAWVITDGNVDLSTYAKINSPTFTGTPKVPTASFGDNSTIIASTAWVQNQLANYAPIYNPVLTGTPQAPTASTGTNNTQIATTAFVQNQIANQVIGLGFGGTKWHNVTSSRSYGVQYVNNYSYPIMVASSTNFGGPTAAIQGYVDGLLVAWWQWQFNGSGSIGGAIMIVPPGSTYQLNGNFGVQNWVELY